ncbi:MAG: single-stranded-DNA-specific exonuclease RecJ [Clostridia bacterium]|nr:single-stranded-DNA-specific exonuclease RecJ [Clostridia bacterium]
MVKKKWQTKGNNSELIESLNKTTNLNPVVLNLLINRGINTEDKIKNFLEHDISYLHDPFLLPDMDKAVARIKKAVENKEKIAVFGDYDVDGITGVSVLLLYLRDELKADVCYYIPDRLKEGYGLNMDALNALADDGVTLIVTVDCGITASEEAKEITKRGVEMIITDHHECQNELPECVAVVNPKREDSEYPYRELAGVGVAFKLIQALAGNKDNEYLLEKYSEIVALGTVADIVPLLDENRILVAYGIKYMRNDKNFGLKSLLDVANLTSAEVNAGTLGFQIAPRINAAGRMGNANVAVELFAGTDKQKIVEIAKELNEENNIRQSVEQQILEEAKQMVRDEKLENKNIIILAKEGWHNGVIGIVASRITEEFYRPCILISLEDGIGKGSCRSIKGVNIYELLTENKDTLIKFGGHELAAGISIDVDKIPEFKEKMLASTSKIITNEILTKTISIDAEIAEDQMTIPFVKELNLLEPYGMGNPQPTFIIKNAKIAKIAALKDGKHLKLIVCKKKKSVDCIGFSMGHYVESLRVGDTVSLACNLYINDYRGECYFGVRIRDIRLS